MDHSHESRGHADHGSDHAAHGVAEAGMHDHADGGGHGGHDKHAGHSVAMFRNKFWLTLLLTLPTLVWGEMIPRLLGFTPPAVPGAPSIPGSVSVSGSAAMRAGIQGDVRTSRSN